MISFMISVVPPKIDWARLNHQRSQMVPEIRGLMLPPVKVGLHLVSASGHDRAVRAGRRSPARGSYRRAANPPPAA